jgi:hypothetical protein
VSIRRKKGVGIATLLVAGALAMGAYAFTASNTVSAQQVGAGNNTATGYTVSGIKYTFNTSDVSKVDAVEFDLNSAADTVKAQLDTSDHTTSGTPNGTVYSCVVTGTVSAGGGTLTATSTHPVCDLGGVANSSIRVLTVAATKQSA